MPRTYEMTWVERVKKDKQTGAVLKRYAPYWRKVFRGQVYTVSCKELRDQGHEVLADTKLGSRIAANGWWRKKEMEIVAAGRPLRRAPEPLEDVVAAALGQDNLAELGVSPAGERPDGTYDPGGMEYRDLEDIRRLIDRVGPEVILSLIKGRPLFGLAERLPAGRLQEVQAAAKALRGGPAVAPEKRVGALAEKWLQGHQLREAAKELSLGAMDNKRRWVARFVDFVGPEADVAAVTDQLLDAWDNHCLGRRAAKENGEEGGWGDYLCRDIRAAAREFVGWLADRGAIPRPAWKGRRFRLAPREPKPWTVEEYRAGLAASADKARLILLLMANCGFYQKDASDLLDSEVDWDKGYIIRRRSKERHLKNAPRVRYKLWPTTLALLNKHRSGQEQVLTTDCGKPFVRERWKGGSRVRVDSFNDYFRRLRKRIAKAVPGFVGTPKGVRKMAATLLKKHPAHRAFVDHFLGHAPNTTADRYYAETPREEFDEAVLWLGRQLGQVEAGPSC
jgi:integrase